MDSKAISKSEQVASVYVEKKDTDWKKVSCIALTLLFLAATAASYHYNLNDLFLITSASAAGVFLIASVFLHIRKRSELEVESSPSIKDALQLDEIPEKYVKNDDKIDILKYQILLRLKDQSFDEHIQTINDLFAVARNDQAKFKVLVEIILNECDFLLVYSAKLLESISWPKGMEDQLEIILAEHIAVRACQVDENSTTKVLEAENFLVNLLTVDMSEVFGPINCIEGEYDLPKILGPALGSAIQSLVKKVSDKELGFAIIFDQRNCKLPATVILPILPSLKDINLVSFKLMQEAGFHNMNLTNFSSEEAVHALLDVLDSNPYMVDLKVSFVGITEQHQEWIDETLEANRKRALEIN